MLIALFTFFFDCINASIFAQWITSSLLFYFIALQIFDASFDYTIKKFYFPLFLLLLQDFLLYGRFGLALLWLAPLIGIIWWSRKMMLCGTFLLPFILTAGCIFFDDLVIKLLVDINQPLLLVTICKICYTWGCGIIMFLGLRGNRCLSILHR